jgi:hypothetical protein
MRTTIVVTMVKSRRVTNKALAREAKVGRPGPAVVGESERVGLFGI